LSSATINSVQRCSLLYKQCAFVAACTVPY